MEFREYYINYSGDIVRPERGLEEIYEDVGNTDLPKPDGVPSKPKPTRPQVPWILFWQSKFAVAIIVFLSLVSIGLGVYSILKNPHQMTPDTTTTSGETTPTTTYEMTTSPPDKESPWHIIFGGNSEKGTPFVHNVELFNWQTFEQCTFGSLPDDLCCPIGAVFESQPVYCGGGRGPGVFENRCFKFDSVSKTWIQIENLLSAAYWAASAVVPGRGWFIYGGLNNPSTYSQMLTSISSKWEIGPQLYESKVDYKHCIVQVNESTTVFLGGMNNPTAIVSFDWTTMSYTKHSPELTSGRTASACALVQGSNGENLAVVASGSSSGMAAWNSVDGKVQVLDPNFPAASGREKTPQLVSVKGGLELIFYETSDYNHGIWKYVYLTKTWTKIGVTLEYRNDFAALPVFDVACPRIRG